MSRRSRDKGQRGEREVKDAFIDLMGAIEAELSHVVGINARRCSLDVKRNQNQSDGGGYDISGIPLLAVEVKRCETLALNEWWQQCARQARGTQLQPVLFYRASRQP